MAWRYRDGGGGRAASQASCASGTGQLEGVENQPFPPPEGAPEDSGGNWQTHLPRGFGQASMGDGEHSRLFLGGQQRGLGERKTTSPDAQSRKTSAKCESSSFAEVRTRGSRVQTLPAGCPGPQFLRASRGVGPGEQTEPRAGTAVAPPSPTPPARRPCAGGTHCDTWVMGVSSVSPSRSRSSAKLLVLVNWAVLTSSSVGLFFTAGKDVGQHVRPQRRACRQRGPRVGQSRAWMLTPTCHRGCGADLRPASLPAEGIYARGRERRGDGAGSPARGLQSSGRRGPGGPRGSSAPVTSPRGEDHAGLSSGVPAFPRVHTGLSGRGENRGRARDWEDAGCQHGAVTVTGTEGCEGSSGDPGC